MHVVQVNYAYDPAIESAEALLERYPTLTGWTGALVGSGVRVTVVQRFSQHRRLLRDGAHYVFAGDLGVHAAVVAAGADVVHVNGLEFPFRTWRLRQKLPPRTAVVVQDHASRPPRPSEGILTSRFVRNEVRRWLLADVDGFLFAAAAQASAWQGAGVMTAKDRVYEVMEAAASLSPVERGAARADTAVDGSPSLLWVGRLNANKDPLTVLRGFEIAATDLPHARLTMVYSENDLQDEVSRRIDQSPVLRERVRLVGQVPHARLAAYYSAADLFVLGSHSEGSGYALLEACACGAVPVVTDIPSFRVITGAGAIGALWTAGDAEACARAIVSMARQDLGAASARVRARAEQTLSWSAVAEQAIAAYRDAYARRASR